jgi:hypothetical protein
MHRESTLEQQQARLSTDKDDYYYVGITGRNWLLRLSEHLREIHRGSRRTFYQAWRDSLGIKDVLFISSLMDINLKYEDAMLWEELNVDRVAYGPQGLNMIPGGFKGLEFLHKHRITDRVNISIEERNKAIEEYIRRNPRKGIPNPFIAELWKSEEFIEKNICSKKKTLSPEQVRRIRKLYEAGVDIDKIVDEVNALNVTQVKNVITGKYYGWVH